MMRKKLVVAMLCILLVFANSACSASSKEGQADSGDTSPNSMEVRELTTSESDDSNTDFSASEPEFTPETPKQVETEAPKITNNAYLDFDEAAYPHLELLGTCYECSICYDTLTSQFVCMKDGKEAGERIDVSLQDVLDFKKQITSAASYDIGYVDSQNQIIYPIVQNSSSGISFHLYSLSTYVEQTDYDESEPNFYVAELASCGIHYNIFYNIYNSVFYTVPDEIISYKDFMGSCAFISVNAESVEFTEHHVVMSELVDIILIPDEDLYACMGNIRLWGSYTPKGCHLSEMQANHVFEKYFLDYSVFSDGVYNDAIEFYNEALSHEGLPGYFCPTWEEALKIIEYSNTH